MSVPTKFDSIFELLRGSQGVAIPLQFMRALAWMESGMNPENKTGKHWGLFQVTAEVVADFNKTLPAASEKLTHQEMLLPTYNTSVWVWYESKFLLLYDRWAKSGSIYERPLKVNMRTNFNNPEFCKIAVAGWNSGPYGLLKIAKWLVSKGKPVTHANLFLHAKDAGVRTTLYSAKKKTWQSQVVALFGKLAGKTATPTPPKTPELPDPKKPGSVSAWGWLLVLLAIALSKKS